MTKEKACTRCREVKPLTDFPPHAGRKDGRNSHCRACKAEYKRRLRERDHTGPFAEELQREARLETLFLGKAPEGLEREVQEAGLCHHHSNPEWWLADYESDRTSYFKAQRLCGECPMQDQCRLLADYIEEPLPQNRGYLSGIWGGEGPSDRANRRRRAAA